MSFFLTKGVLQQQANRAGGKQYALEFDGVDDYVETDYQIDGSQDFTIEFWQEMPENPAEDGCWLGQGRPHFLFYSNTNYGSANNQSRLYLDEEVLIGSDIRGKGQVHIAVIRKGDTFTLYYDGIEESTGISSEVVPTDAFHIGHASRYGDRYFEGSIWDFRVWNVARSQSEIQDNMNKILTGNESGLQSYYKINEGEGDTVEDSAGNNDGTIYGANWIEL